MGESVQAGTSDGWVRTLEARLPEEEAGPKAATLSRLRADGYPVPPGIVIPASAWSAFAASAGLQTVSASDAADRCRSAALPPGLTAALESAVAPLGDSLAVRSSALAEDGASASAAGIFRTVLDVSPPDVVAALRACWASWFDPVAQAYLAGRDDVPQGMAVLIQPMVEAEAAGVLFTRGAKEPLLLEAVPGLGRALVDGEVDPIRLALGRDGSAGAPPAFLPRAALLALAALAVDLEERLGGPLDIEWAWDGGVHLLQARPVTRAAPTLSGRVRWTAANTQEALLDPVTPLTWSLLSPLVEAGRRDLFRAAGFTEIRGPGYMKLFHGLPYFNPEYFRAFLRQIPGCPETIFDVLIFGEGDGIDFRLPEFNATTLRCSLLFVLGRLLARERFELYQRLFSVRLRLLTRRPLTARSDADLIALRRQATDLLEGALRRHVLGTAISGGAYLLLELFLRKSGLTTAAGLVSRLTSGARGNALAEAGTRLEELARRLAERVEAEPDLLARLERLDADDEPTQELLAFLRTHGHRCEKEAELAEPRWADEPSALLEVLRSYVAAATGHGQGLASLTEREERLTARARHLAGTVARRLVEQGGWLERVLPARRLLFRYLLREARRYAPYRENLKDRALRALHLVRRIYLEVGLRLVGRGALDAPDDVFFVPVDALEAAFLGAATTDLRPIVAAARAERAQHLAEPAPRHVIEVPGRPPQPVFTTGRSGRLLEGAGVSGGKVTGIARVLGGLDDAMRLNPGDVLVARVVNAGWTPLFHLAGAIVAEVGGVLSHGAIVAREYGIPAVFGVSGAAAIPDGATISVDGDLGIVTVLAREQDSIG